MEAKLDELLKSVQSLSDEQKQSQTVMKQRLDQLEKDVSAKNEETTERVVKRLKRARTHEFKRKGNEKQFEFNEEVKDRMETASAHLAKLPKETQEIPGLKSAAEELSEGIQALHTRQKLIRLADRSDLGWAVVDAYESDELASDDEDAKRMKEAKKAADQKDQKERKKKQAASQKSGRATGSGWRNQSSPYVSNPAPVAPGAYGVPMPLTASGVTRPRQVGPCFHCLEMGHLKAHCPKRSRTYPLNQLDSSCVGSSVNIVCNDSVVYGNYHSYVSNAYQAESDSPQSSSAGDEVMACSGEHVEGPELFELGRYWELEHDPEQITDVQGRLRDKVSFWRETLHAPGPIIDCITNGYKLPLLSAPPQYARPNHQSALDNAEFVETSLAELLSNRCVRNMADVPHVCSPLSVVINRAGKKRLVLNLRFLNQHLLKDKFKYEDIRLAMLMFQKDDFMFSFDLKAGYHHIDIHQEHWKYLGFAWNNGSKVQFYVFCVLPFGLMTACYLFTKLMRPLVKYWRGQGLRIIVYLDDGIAAVAGEEAACTASSMVQEDLHRAGLVVNVSKCKWVPNQKCAWLGFDIDLNLGQISAPQDKVQSLLAHIKDIMSQDSPTARSIASVTGKIISMSLAIGPVSRLMTRSLYALLNSRQSWCGKLPLSQEAKSELQFWLEGLETWNGQGIWHSPAAIRVVYTDASHTGYGGYTVEHGCHIAHGTWLPEEQKESSTWRELQAVRQVLESLVGKLQNQRVRWFTDSQNVARILTVGSRKSNLQTEALAIFATALANHVRIEPEWIPRYSNQKADYISRIVDYDDWSVDPEIFTKLDIRWGHHTVDRFASYYNTQLPRFISRFWNPGSEGVDTFTCDWRDENNWLCPPICLIPRAIRHAGKCSASATLLVPQWPSAPFWPMLFPNGIDPANFISDYAVIHKSELIVHPGRLGSNLFKGAPNTNFLALRLNFRAQ